MKTLILLRHAKTEAATSNFDDFDRALTSRGRAAAALIGGWLAENGPRPAAALVSTARRAQQTWDIVAPALGADVAEHRVRALYLATPGELLARLAAVDDAAASVIMVGHNPGMETLARLLAGPGSAPEAEADLARGMPTGGLAIFDIDADSWRDIGAVPSRLATFVRPRDLAEAQ